MYFEDDGSCTYKGQKAAMDGGSDSELDGAKCAQRPTDADEIRAYNEVHAYQTDDCDQLIDNVLFVYRSSRHDSTRCTPFLLMYGREARLPIDLSRPM